MAQFDIDATLSNGKRIDWLALPDEGEAPEQAVKQVKRAACEKFGMPAFLAAWTHVVATNGYVTVQMHV